MLATQVGWTALKGIFSGKMDPFELIDIVHKTYGHKMISIRLLDGLGFGLFWSIGWVGSNDKVGKKSK